MARTAIFRPAEPPLPANDVPMVVMVGPLPDLAGQRALFTALGVRFLGFRHGDTLLLALLTTPASVILLGSPADMTPVTLLRALADQGERAPVVRHEDAGWPRSVAAAQALLVRLGVLPPRLCAVS